MSHKDLRPNIPVNRRTRPSHHSPTPSPSHSSLLPRRTSPTPKRSSKQLKPLKVFQRCNSDPTLRDSGATACLGDNDRRNPMTPDCLLLRPQTCTETSSSPDLFYRSPLKIEGKGYNKDSKVLVNVTVEGSPGAIRTMVKLGTSVEEAIKLVLSNYTKEGRSPRLHDHDHEGDGVVVSSASFELHSSYFSLQSLNKSELIGDIGGRSFYLRKCKNVDKEEKVIINSEKVYAERGNTKESLQPPFIFLPTFFSRKINKIIRSTRMLWKILGCLESN